MNMQISAHIGLLYNRSEIVYFNSFGGEHVPEETKNIFRVQANDSIMCGYFCIGSIDFMLSGKN